MKLGIKRAAMAAAAGLLGAGAVAAIAPGTALAAGGEPCGVTVDYGDWRSGVGYGMRNNTWIYHNCGGGTVRKNAVINNHDDSGCRSVGPGGFSYYSWLETDSLVGHYGAYERTTNC